MIVLGMREKKFTNSGLEGKNNSFEKNEFTDTRYEIVVLEKGQLFELDCSTSHGMCSSGWTTASWGSIEVKEIDDVGALHYTPTNFTELEFDLKAIPIDLKNSLFQYAEFGFDSYYPNGEFFINKENWRPTGRLPEKEIVYIFHGKSGLGKSTLASLLNEKIILESDNEKSFIEFCEMLELKDLTNAVIVVGNKHQAKISDLPLEKLQNKYKLITVKFEIEEES